jgi:hypothetical protein
MIRDWHRTLLNMRPGVAAEIYLAKIKLKKYLRPEAQ